MEPDKSGEGKEKKENPMREIIISKLTLNIGAGTDQGLLDKGMKLLEAITGMKPVKTVTHKRIAGWGLRPGLPIGCKVTVRKDTKALIKRLLEGRDNILDVKNFDNNGNVSFGVSEYIEIPGVKYDPDIGIIGLEASVTLERRGFRIKRKRLPSRVGKKHRISREEAIAFFEKEFNIKVGESNELQQSY